MSNESHIILIIEDRDDEYRITEPHVNTEAVAEDAYEALHDYIEEVR